MTNYLLLRNNKESGPFNRQQLKEMGLKPYDLVWAESKSAAWRYPGEVDELKEFAPIVEEQPFDRFFKRPDDKKEKHFFEIIEEAEKDKAKKRKVFLRRQVPVKKKKSNSKIYVSIAEVSRLSFSPVQINEITNEKTTNQVDHPQQVEAPDLGTEKMDTPVDNFKKQYADLHKIRIHKNIRKKYIKKIMEYTVAALFLLTLGTLIYLNFRPGDFKQVVNTVPVKNNFYDKTAKPITSEKKIETRTGMDEPIMAGTNNPVVKKEIIPIDKNSKSTGLNSSIEPSTTETEEIKTGSGNTAADGQRQKALPNDVDFINKMKTDISSQVTVKINEYKRRAFGGIENLQVTVVNSSGFFLDKVVVELVYLKPSELPLKTEKVEFSSIAPDGSVTLKIPDSPRGIRVQCKITEIVSDQFDRSLVGM